jgi:hypothetical protein
MNPTKDYLVTAHRPDFTTPSSLASATSRSVTPLVILPLKNRIHSLLLSDYQHQYCELSAASISAMEGMDTNWDDLLHDSLQYAVEPLGHSENMHTLHAYDFDLSTGFWGTQSVSNLHSNLC